MNLESMVGEVRDDTQIADTGAIIAKLNGAQDWCANRLLVMDEDVLKQTNDEISITADTRTFDLAANVSTGVLYQLKWFGVKLSGETVYTGVSYVNSSDDDFISLDQETTAATAHPILVAIENFNQVRFAPFLESGDSVRADYIYKPAPLSLDTQTTSQIPEPFHQALVWKAIARCFRMIDDTRASVYDRDALDSLQGAMNVLGQRQYQQPQRTRPFSRLRSGYRRIVPTGG